MIRLESDTYVDTVWIVHLANGGGNFIACLHRTPPDDWRAMYRFKYHRDRRDKPFALGDDRTWYSLSDPTVGDELRERLRVKLEAAAKAVATTEGVSVQRFVINAVGIDAFATMFAAALS